ncbi:MAG: DUF5597 domain-containing protein [Bacteroidaceae bacterium]|nr:DUF5597 domain-containing protein [Bacteroidaceae bacterium]
MCVFFTLPSLLSAQSITTLQKRGNAWQLVQDGQPFVMLAGELHNSSSSTPIALHSTMKTAQAMGLNSVIATVSWEQIEPEEGRFDFSCMDELLKAAETYKMRLGIAWFGSWKNGESSYAPLWVKSDTKRFFRARDAQERNTTTLSPFCEAAMKADAAAYRRLMEYIAQKDTKRLVCVMQVENEVGAFIDIDHSEASMKEFRTDVPELLSVFLKKNYATAGKRLAQRWNENGKRTKGSWADLFGENEDAKQFFMAWAYARYVDYVAEEGKKAHPLPMYTNCWLAGDDAKVGTFPNSGPRGKVLDIWKIFAPHVDWLSPDVYSTNYSSVFGQYHRSDNPLFIPEINREGGPAYYAFGEHDAMCYAPFGFEETYNDPYLLGEYQTLGELLPLITQHQGTGHMHGFIRQEGIHQPDDSCLLDFKDVLFKVKYIKGEHRAHGLVVRLSDDEFIVAGVGGYLLPQAVNSDKQECKIAYAEELQLGPDGEWQTIYVLNGDETAHHNMIYLRGRMPLKDYKEYGFNIPAPLYRPSYQRMNNKQWQDPLKFSGIYRFKIYTYPKK